MAPPKLEIKYVAIDTLKPWDKNPKKHNKEAIKKSIMEFNPTNPILIQKGTNRIIAGHGRWEAFKELKYKEVPIIELPLTDAQADKYTLGDNQLTIAYGWDEVLLKLQIDDIRLKEPDYDLSILGFEPQAPIEKGANNPYDEWQGMPSYENEDVSGRKIIMHFANEDDVQSFAKVIGQTISPQTKTLWYPKLVREAWDTTWGEDEGEDEP